MTTKPVTGIRIKDGKIQRVHKISAPARKGAHAKAARKEKAWKAKSK